MILTDSNNQVVVALNSYANSGKMVQINPEKIADNGKLYYHASFQILVLRYTGFMI